MPTCVEPEVWLIARPTINWDEIRSYLSAVGGEKWLDNYLEQDAMPEAETLIEFAGRLCYRSWEPGLNPNVTKVRRDSAEYFQNILQSGHGSVLEHSYFSFVFHNVSRVFTHELVRHRVGDAFSQESMRFVRLEDIPFWFPDWAEKDIELRDRGLALLEQMEEFQEWMKNHFALHEEGVPFHEKKARTSFMRRFLPEGVATGILFTANIRTLRHVITMRTDPAAEEEIRMVFSQVARLMRDECPILFGDFQCDPTDGAWRPRYKKV